MKVLQINAVIDFGSTGRICAEISDYLNRNGDECHIAHSKGISCPTSYRIGTFFDVKLHGLFSRFFGMQAYFSRYETKKLLNYIMQLKPDVVHLHNLHGNYVNLNLLLNYLVKNDIPTVITLHDCWFYTGKCVHYTVDKCYKWKTGCQNCPRLKKDNPSWFFDRTRKMYEDKKKGFCSIPRLAVVGVSDWITHEAKQSFLSSAKILTKIYNWVDLDVFRPVNTEILKRKLGLENKFILLGIASGWNNNKGLDRFIELSSIIEEDMVIVLVGNVKKSVELPSNIMNIAEINDADELVEYYSLADVFINLSLEESFGKVVAESLACGTPVIAINSTANAELVGENCGYIMNSQDIRNILQPILNIKKVGKLYYSRYCIAFAKRNFNSSDRLQNYYELYKKIMLR